MPSFLAAPWMNHCIRGLDPSQQRGLPGLDPARRATRMLLPPPRRRREAEVGMGRHMRTVAKNTLGLASLKRTTSVVQLLKRGLVNQESLSRTISSGEGPRSDRVAR